MPRKRPQVDVTALEPRGRGAILRPAAEIQREQQLLADSPMTPMALTVLRDIQRTLEELYGARVSLSEIAEAAAVRAQEETLDPSRAPRFILQLARRRRERRAWASTD